MTLEKLAKWNEDMAVYAEAIGRKDCTKNSLASAAACREAQRGRIVRQSPVLCHSRVLFLHDNAIAETDRLLKECK